MNKKKDKLIGIILIIIALVIVIIFISNQFAINKSNNEEPESTTEIQTESDTLSYYEKADYDEILNSEITVSGLSEKAINCIDYNTDDLNKTILEYVQYTFNERVTDATFNGTILNEANLNKYVLTFTLSDAAKTTINVNYYWDSHTFEIN